MLELIQPALLTTVQDAGRYGWQAWGVPRSGPMDALALAAANRLAGNPPEAAALELGLSGASLYAHDNCLLALAGPGFSLNVYGWRFGSWSSVYVRAGTVVEIEKGGDGNWAILAVHGGIQTPPALGSRATTLKSTLTGEPARPLQPGGMLPIGPARAHLPALAGRKIAPPLAYSPNPTLRTLPGPQRDWFGPEALAAFYGSAYRISAASDRSGYRLTGPPLARSAGRELLSEGLACGCIQIPADGQPIVMQADSPTTGGYPKIASVIAADQPLLAQTAIASGQIRFVETTIAQAQSSYRALMDNLEKQIAACLADDDYLWAGF
ncbi:MAG: biotin-dependent carboxyltransferase family protein [Anaerolineales bacterium]|jgi:biotin-dependent carboxylase-like uncharacterized protein|nr:biotin-dependent carboxyltransferase family protein [Anaerolineales bacterium]